MAFEVLQGVVAEVGEEVAVDRLPVAVAGGQLELPPGEVLAQPTLGELGDGVEVGVAPFPLTRWGYAAAAFAGVSWVVFS